MESVKALLALNEKPKDIAEKTGVAYQKVLKIKKDFEREKLEELKTDAIAIDSSTVQLVVDKAKELKAPMHTIKKLEKVQEGLSSIQMLDTEFHKTFTNILGKADDYLTREDLKPSEFVAITNALSAAYNNIFNNNGVNVHVDNSTNVSSNAVQMMRGAMRG